MKYLASFGCAALGFTGLVCVPSLGKAQEPSAAPAPAAPPATVEAAPAPAGALPNAAAVPTDGAAPRSEAPTPAAPGAAPERPGESGRAPAVSPAPAGAALAPAVAAQGSGSEPAAPPAPVVAEAPAAAAVIPEDSEAPAGFSGRLGTHQDHWFVWLGVRNDYVRDATYDLFAKNDALTVFSAGGGRTVWKSGDLSLAALGLWEVGSRSAHARGNEMYLRVQRFELGPEVRYHLHYRLYGFGRLGLGAEYVFASLDNELFKGDLVSKSWAFAGDLTAGAAFQAFGNPSGERRLPRMWLVAEGGYSLVTNTQLSFAAESGDVPERSQAEELGELDLSAPFFRLAVLGTY